MNILPQDAKYELMLNADIKTISNLCTLDKNYHNICNDPNFWLRKFNHDGLPLPNATLSPVGYMKTYSNTFRIMRYIDFVLDNYNEFHIQFEDVFVFQDYLDKVCFEKIYLEMQTSLKDYFSYVRDGYDDDEIYGYLFVSFVNNDDQFKITLRKKYRVDVCSSIVNTNDIRNILYQLISTYHYPYADMKPGGIGIIKYDI